MTVKKLRRFMPIASGRDKLSKGRCCASQQNWTPNAAMGSNASRRYARDARGMSAMPPLATKSVPRNDPSDVPIAVLESCLLQTQYGECLLRPMHCLPQGDFRPAETHRDPSGDQLQHKLAGVTTIVRHVIGKLDADPPLFGHHPHFKWRRACRKAVPEHRQPVSLGEIEEHCRITALGDDPSGGGIGLEPMLFKILLPHHALHSILSI